MSSLHRRVNAANSNDRAVREPDSPQALRNRALRLLAGREHTCLELTRKLTPHAPSPEVLQALLETLMAKGLLSDERYAEARSHSLQRKFGVSRIARELRDKGVAAETVERLMRDAQATELSRARDVWKKKFGLVATDAAGRAKQMRFLASRGFGFAVIRRVTGAEDAEETA